VCGRLLAQDESDEPADLLIDRIEALKASQISSGAVKRQKAATQPTVQPNHAIPESWRFVQLGDVVEIVRGITFPASEKSKEPSPGRIACLRTANVQSQIEWDDLLYIDESFVSREDQFLQPNDIVMSMANSRELVGKVALVGEESLQRSTFGGFLGVLRPYLIEPRFVMALLRTPSARSALIDSASQTTNIANISLAKLRPLMVALPPLAEQHRIVAKVDELMALCDRLEADQADAEAAHAQLVQALLDSLTQATDAADFRSSWRRLSEHFHTLFTTEASIDALKQTVLQLAVMGKLVPQDSGDESPLVLLEHIAREIANKTRSTRLQKSRTHTEVEQAERYVDTPSSWVWTRLGSQVLDSGAGWSPSCEARPRVNHEWGVLKVSAVSWGAFRPEENKALPANLEARPEHEVHAGDFLVSRANTAELVARSVVVESPPPRLMLSDKIVRFKLTEHCNRRYINLVNSSPFARSYYGVMAGGTSSSMKNVTREQILNLPLPLPPLAEQHRIVAKVDELMALCDQLKAQLAEARQQHAQLATALVEQAVA